MIFKKKKKKSNKKNYHMDLVLLFNHPETHKYLQYAFHCVRLLLS